MREMSGDVIRFARHVRIMQGCGTNRKTNENLHHLCEGNKVERLLLPEVQTKALPEGREEKKNGKTMMEPKYKIGDVVFRIKDNTKIVEFVVRGVYAGEKNCFYANEEIKERLYFSGNSATWRNEEELFASKQDLIASL